MGVGGCASCLPFLAGQLRCLTSRWGARRKETGIRHQDVVVHHIYLQLLGPGLLLRISWLTHDVVTRKSKETPVGQQRPRHEHHADRKTAATLQRIARFAVQPSSNGLDRRHAEPPSAQPTPGRHAREAPSGSRSLPARRSPADQARHATAALADSDCLPRLLWLLWC